jgi:hypothetical protein
VVEWQFTDKLCNNSRQVDRRGYERNCGAAVMCLRRTQADRVEQRRAERANELGESTRQESTRGERRARGHE